MRGGVGWDGVRVRERECKDEWVWVWMQLGWTDAHRLKQKTTGDGEEESEA